MVKKTPNPDSFIWKETKEPKAGCPHDERDHGICLDCGDVEDPGEAIDLAMDIYEGER